MKHFVFLDKLVYCFRILFFILLLLLLFLRDIFHQNRFSRLLAHLFICAFCSLALVEYTLLAMVSFISLYTVCCDFFINDKKIGNKTSIFSLVGFFIAWENYNGNDVTIVSLKSLGLRQKLLCFLFVTSV